MAHIQKKVRRSGQVTLELAVALLVVMLLIVATVKIFVWLNEGIVRRQYRYENSRIAAGGVESTVPNAGPLTDVTAEDLKFTGERTGVIDGAFETLNIVE